jgi:glycosyltransferase involved in cell wall biosynthesis
MNQSPLTTTGGMSPGPGSPAGASPHKSHLLHPLTIHTAANKDELHNPPLTDFREGFFLAKKYTIPHTMKTFLIIPAFNEGQRLKKTINESAKFIPEKNIVVVDDGSKTKETLPKGSKATLIRHQINLGKGMAMKTGADFAFGRGADNIIFIDADLQHNPKYLPKFKKLLKDNDLVFASRIPSLKAPLVRLLGNKLASIYINMLFKVYISDLLSGYRALSKKAYRLLKWDSPRYGVETEMVARLGKNKNKLKWAEFPIETIYVNKYKGVTIIDAINIFVNSLWWKLS